MKRFDKGYFYYSLVSSLAAAFIIVFGIIGFTMEEEYTLDLSFALVCYAVVYLALVIYAALYVKTSGYELLETELRCKRGVIFRKSSVLQYSRVHAVNKKQGLIQRIFGIAVLTVDSGATANAFSAEIVIIEKSETVDRLMTQIKQYQKGEGSELNIAQAEQKNKENEKNLYYFNSKLKMAYSLITVSTSLICLLALGFAAAVLLLAAVYILRVSINFSSGEMMLAAAVITAIVLILSSIISLIGGMLSSFIGYHGFKIHRKHDDVEISYGLFVRHTNNFKFKRIKAVKINQGPIKKLFGFASAGLEVVGYGNDDDSTGNNSSQAPGILLPLCRQKDINKVIEDILPDYAPDRIENKSKSYPSFILWPFFWVSVSFAAAFSLVTVFLPSGYIIKALLLTALILAAILLTTALFKIFQYRNAGLTIGQDKLTIQNGILVKTNTVIKRKDLIAIETITTPLRERKGIYSYKIHFFTNALTNTVTVKNLDAALADRLEGFLKY